MSDEIGDIIVLGARSVLTAWAFDLLRFLCSLSTSPVAVHTVDRSEPIAPLPAEGTRTALFAHFPTQDLLDRAALPNSRVLLFLDDPADTVRFVQVAGGYSLQESIRYGAAALAGYVSLRGLPTVQILHRDIESPARMLYLAMSHLNLEADSDALSLGATYFGPEGPSGSIDSALKQYFPHYFATADVHEKPFTSEEAALIAGALTPLIQMSLSEAPVTIVWPTSMFRSGDRPQTTAPVLTDLTGGARILYYGPNIHLPAGEWRVQLLLGFTEAARKMPFSAEVITDKQLARVIMVPEHKGVFVGSFEFSHENALHSVEIRIRVDRGAIDGYLAFGRVELQPRAGLPKTPE